MQCEKIRTMMNTAFIILPVIFLFLTNVPRIGAIKCYKCDYTKSLYYTNKTQRLCSEFDYSDDFVVDCPFSTLCMKKSFAARIRGLINGTERGCAHQKNETQFFTDGAWRPKISIAEPYKEGCFKEENRGQKTSVEFNCYCRGDLCNDSSTIESFYFLTILSVISSLLFCKTW